MNCWLWLCNFQAQFWCWRPSRIDYHNYLTIWLSQLSDHVRFSDCHNYLMHSVRFTDWLKNSNLTQHYRNIWLTPGILAPWYFVIYDKCWFQPFDAIGRIIWRSQLQKKKMFSMSQHCNIFIYDLFHKMPMKQLVVK